MTSREIVAAVVAGLVSAVTLAAFAAFAEALSGASPSVTYRALAVDVGGPSFATLPAAVPVGALVLVACALGWAFGYVYAARRQTQLLTRPYVSGAVFGIVVWFVMQLVLITAARWSVPTVHDFSRDILACTLFFGMPLAFTAARLQRAR